MMTQTERESNISCRTGDNKCVPISKAGGGGIQDFLIGVQIYKGGVDLLILPDYLLIFSDFSENSP